jgi:hypothetical protein
VELRPGAAGEVNGRAERCVLAANPTFQSQRAPQCLCVLLLFGLYRHLWTKYIRSILETNNNLDARI